MLRIFEIIKPIKSCFPIVHFVISSNANMDEQLDWLQSADR
jgi:hypothetical protein